MAQSTFHFEATDNNPHEATPADVHLGMLALQLRDVGMIWMARAGKFLSDPFEFQDGTRLLVQPKIFGSGDVGTSIHIYSAKPSLDGIVSVEHGFDSDWGPFDGGAAAVIDGGSTHTYVAELKGSHYRVNGEDYLGGVNVARLERGAIFATAQATFAQWDIPNRHRTD